jgi:hypothetical protein
VVDGGPIESHSMGRRKWRLNTGRIEAWWPVEGAHRGVMVGGGA